MPWSPTSLVRRAPRAPNIGISSGANPAAADLLIERFEQSDAAVREADRAVVHTDVGLHNVSIDPASLAVQGIFDWEGACWADRHYDFRHLVFDRDQHPLFTAAVSTYEESTGVRISRARIYLHNAAMAITYLAFRRGVAAEERWCGRTLEEDLGWSRAALARVGLRT